MRLMGLRSVAPRPFTSRRAPGHVVYPYLLGDIQITRVNHAWCVDLTYIPMAHGFLYVMAIMDWHCRKVLAWRLSNTQDTAFCVEALEEAIERYGCPEIFNTDQGSQFTSTIWTSVLKHHGVRISMDGKGQWMDNVFRAWMDYYNDRRPHSALGDLTTGEVYDGITLVPSAA